MCVEAALCPATTVLLLRLAKSISETIAADGADCTVSSADRSVRWVPAGEGSTDQRDATIGALGFWTHVRMIVQQHVRR